MGPCTECERRAAEIIRAALECDDPADRVAVVEPESVGELTMEQIAAALECSRATAEREWRYARAWLRSQLTGNPRAE